MIGSRPLQNSGADAQARLPGMVPGEPRATSGFLVGRRPSELLVKLRELFGGDPEDDPG